MSGWSVIFIAIVIGILCLAGHVFAPKGDNQTYPPCDISPFLTAHILLFPLCYPLGVEVEVVDGSVWRYSIILTLVSCYLLWAITYLAQLHPLIEPRASKLRPDIVHGETF